MTLREVMDWQSRVRAAGAPATAAGGYQIIRATLGRLVRTHGLDRDALFDPAMQDRLARLLVAECGEPGLRPGISASPTASPASGPRFRWRRGRAGEGLPTMALPETGH